MKPTAETAEECISSASKDDTVEPLKWNSKTLKISDLEEYKHNPRKMVLLQIASKEFKL